MKANEFRQRKQVNELGLRHIIGDYGASALKQIGNRITGNPEGDLSVQDKIGKEKYIQNFIGRVSTSLSSAIQSGLVDPSISGGTTATTPGASAPATPGASAPKQFNVPGSVTPNMKGQLPTQAGAAKPAATTPAAGSALPKQFNVPGSVTPSMKGKLPTQTGATKPAATAPTGSSVDLDQLKQQRAARQAAGIAGQQQAMQQMAATQQANTTAAKADNELVSRVKAEKLKPGFQQDKGLLRQAAVKGIHEDTYTKLNNIFENLLNENAESINTYLKQWLKQYPSLKGVNLSNPKIDKLISNVQSTYGKDRGKVALNQLANATYSLIYSNMGSVDNQQAGGTAQKGPISLAGGNNQQSSSTSQAAPAATPAAPGTASTDPVQQVLAQFKALNTTQQQKLLAMISSNP